MSVRPCRWPGCPEWATRGGYCPGHTQAVDQAITRGRRTDKRYATKRWRILSRRITSRDVVCQVCRTRMATAADHIVAVEDGGSFWDEENLQGICPVCHGSKTNSEVRGRRYGADPVAKGENQGP